MNNIKLSVRLATLNNLNRILELVTDAKQFLLSSNSTQWQSGYPNKETIQNDIKMRGGYCLYIDGFIEGYMFVSDYDETYNKVYDGSFSDMSYLAIHRIIISSDYRGLGLSRNLIKYAEKIATKNSIDSLRIDTHRNNIPMQKIVISSGFKYCGIIHLKHDPDRARLAYEKIIKNSH